MSQGSQRPSDGMSLPMTSHAFAPGVHAEGSAFDEAILLW